MLRPDMRRILVVLAIGVVAAVAVAIADLNAPGFIAIQHGSIGVEPQTEELELLPADPDCEEPFFDSDEPCPRHYSFRPSTTLTAWISVRNEGPVPVTLDGVSQRWLDQFVESEPLGWPVAGLDGGDPIPELLELRGVPFEPVVLKPGDERMVGVEFRTADDTAHACERWVEGSGVGWEAVPMAWHWLFATHEEELAFAEPITFMAPTAADCSP